MAKTYYDHKPIIQTASPGFKANPLDSDIIKSPYLRHRGFYRVASPSQDKPGKAEEGGGMIRHKYNAKPIDIDGYRFPTKKEGRYYQELKLKQKAGMVLFFLRQVPFHLPGGVKYVVDFQEFHADGTVHFVDVKGFRTAQYIEKKKLVEALYPVVIEEK